MQGNADHPAWLLLTWAGRMSRSRTPLSTLVTTPVTGVDNPRRSGGPPTGQCPRRGVAAGRECYANLVTSPDRAGHGDRAGNGIERATGTERATGSSGQRDRAGHGIERATGSSGQRGPSGPRDRAGHGDAPAGRAGVLVR